MSEVIVYGQDEIASLTRQRTSEEKIGEKVQFAKNDWKNELKQSQCRFVILGVPEDIGVRANLGRAGAATAYKPAIDSFLNQQSNIYLDGSNIFVLGELKVDDLMHAAKDLDQKNVEDLKKLREFTTKVDERLHIVIHAISAAGKIPVVIGGGHNNAYGNIRGVSEALNKKINVINCDPHLDFRQAEGRHSGNGFSYAFKENYLDKYSVLCMHEQYNNAGSLQTFRQYPSRLFYRSYESVFVREEYDFKMAIRHCTSFVKDSPCGVEIDLDAITNVPTSAKTSSGISPLEARQYVYACGANLDAAYLHIAEGAPVLSHIKADNKTGKLIAYLISDFIKGVFARDLAQ